MVGDHRVKFAPCEKGLYLTDTSQQGHPFGPGQARGLVTTVAGQQKGYTSRQYRDTEHPHVPQQQETGHHH